MSQEMAFARRCGSDCVNDSAGMWWGGITNACEILMRLASFVAVLFACSPTIAAEPKLAAKVEKAEVPDALAEPVRKLLDEQALVVRDGEAEVMTVWFRTEIPAKASAEQVKNGLTYREIPEGELVGAIRFPAKFTD